VASIEERLAAVEREVSDIAGRLAAIEGPSGPSSGEVGPNGFAEQLGGRVSAAEGDVGGLVAYAGAVRAGEGELLWDFERGVEELLGLDLAPVAQVLAALGHPVRLALVRALLRGPKASQDLQEEIGLATSGPLYYHLKALTAAGIVSQPNRNRYAVEPRRIVPFLAVLVAAIDAGGM
jgi:DNA-binding transcriptional ArsR family regulator